MKVLVVVPSLRKTGVTEVLRNLFLQSMRSGEVDYSLVALKPESSNNKEHFSKYTRKIFILNGQNNINLSKIRELNKIISKVNPDIIHLNGFVSELYIPFIKGKKL